MGVAGDAGRAGVSTPDYAQECGKCHYFKPALTNGRADKKLCGRCGYEVIWPTAPMSIRWHEPRKSGVWFYQNAESCPCYMGKLS